MQTDEERKVENQKSVIITGKEELMWDISESPIEASLLNFTHRLNVAAEAL